MFEVRANAPQIVATNTHTTTTQRGGALQWLTQIKEERDAVTASGRYNDNDR